MLCVPVIFSLLRFNFPSLSPVDKLTTSWSSLALDFLLAQWLGRLSLSAAASWSSCVYCNRALSLDYGVSAGQWGSVESEDAVTVPLLSGVSEPVWAVPGVQQGDQAGGDHPDGLRHPGGPRLQQRLHRLLQLKAGIARDIWKVIKEIFDIWNWN